MLHPDTEIREYLKKLVDKLLFINGLNYQLKLIKEWETENRIEALNIGTYFFRLVTESFRNTILIELSMLFSDNEDKSIIDFLKKAREQSNSIKITYFNPDPTVYRRVVLSAKKYCENIDGHEEIIVSKDKIIQTVKAHRDKFLVHTDASYFNNPYKLGDDYPLSFTEVDDLIETGNEILRCHHINLLESDISLKVHSISNVDTVLWHIRAYKRIIEDKSLVGFSPLKYKWDDYNINNEK